MSTKPETPDESLDVLDSRQSSPEASDGSSSKAETDSVAQETQASAPSAVPALPAARRGNGAASTPTVVTEAAMDDPAFSSDVISIPDNAEPHDAALPYLTVAFGASAGGLQPVRDILSLLPLDTGMAFVLISHLAPDHPSFMTEILGRATQMPVLPIKQGPRPEPNHIYVLVPMRLPPSRAVSSRSSPAPSSRGPICPSIASSARSPRIRRITPSASFSPVRTPTAPPA